MVDVEHTRNTNIPTGAGVSAGDRKNAEGERNAAKTIIAPPRRRPTTPRVSREVQRTAEEWACAGFHTVLEYLGALLVTSRTARDRVARGLQSCAADLKTGFNPALFLTSVPPIAKRSAFIQDYWQYPRTALNFVLALLLYIYTYMIPGRPQLFETRSIRG